jgi:dephospho-CoA kinase
MFKLGLTGSIGMGKSTTAEMFADEGCAIWDADAAVHRMYSRGGAAVEPIKEVFPQAIRDQEVSRDSLKQLISKDKTVLRQIEKIVHPLVRQDREHFIEHATADILVFDIPLLFEGNGAPDFDAVVTVYVDDETQRKRVLDRGTMSEEQFLMIKSKQMPAEEKKRRADYVIVTDTLESARDQVQTIVKDIRRKLEDA